MSEHPNAALARRVVTAFSQGDLATVGAALAPHAVWELPGASQVAGTYRGPEEILGFLGKAYEMSGGTLTLQVMEIMGSDWGAVQVQRVTAEHAGRQLDCVEVLVHEIINDTIVRTYHRPDEDALKAFFG